MRAKVTFIMNVPEELVTADGTSICFNELALAVVRDLPVVWESHVVGIETRESSNREEKTK